MSATSQLSLTTCVRRPGRSINLALTGALLAAGLAVTTPSQSAQFAAGTGQSNVLATDVRLAHVDGKQQKMHKQQARHKKMGRMHRRHGMRHWFRGLDLTEAQRDKMFELRHANAPAMRELRKQRHRAKQEMRTLVRSEQFDATAVDAAAARLGQATAKLAANRARMMFDMRAVLSAEQLAKLSERQKMKRERRHRQ